MKSRILIVDDHPVFSMALATLLNQEEDFEVCGVVADIPCAKKAITTMSPDLLTIDITLAGDNGLHLVRELSASTCSLPILVLSLHDERIWAKRAIHAGASGYLMKSDAGDNVVLALRNIQSGRIHASARTLAWHPELMQVSPAVTSAHFSQKGADLAIFKPGSPAPKGDLFRGPVPHFIDCVSNLHPSTVAEVIQMEDGFYLSESEFSLFCEAISSCHTVRELDDMLFIIFEKLRSVMKNHHPILYEEMKEDGRLPKDA